jgi:hypothetical protein
VVRAALPSFHPPTASQLSPVPPLGFGLGPGEDGRVLAEGDAGDLEEGEQVRAVLVPVRQARQLHQP